jgi:hypothetical protein
MIIKGPAPLIIRNQRAHRWFNPVAVSLVGLFSMAACGSVGAPATVIPAKAVLPIAIGCLLALGLVLLMIWTCRPVDRLVLSSELMSRPPNFAYQPTQIREVSFGPDPHEDYAESRLPFRLCQATVWPAGGWKLKLIVSAGDAARLRAWAEAKGISVNDPGGHATPGPRSEPS